MYAVAETTHNFDADIASQNIPAKTARPFEIAAKAVPWAVEVHPYEDPAIASTSNLKQACAKDIFKQPQILDNVMNAPGKRGQSIYINLGFGAVNSACDGHFVRQALIMPQLVRHGHAIGVPPVWSPLFTRGINGNDSTLPDGVGNLDFISEHYPQGYWRAGDKARFLLRIQERNAVTKKVVKAVTKIKPIEVKR